MQCTEEREGGSVGIYEYTRVHAMCSRHKRTRARTHTHTYTRKKKQHAAAHVGRRTTHRLIHAATSVVEWCVRVCVCVCARARARACVYRVGVGLDWAIYQRCVDGRVRVDGWVGVVVVRTHSRTRAHTRTHARTHTHTHARTHTRTQSYVHAHVPINTHPSVHAYTQAVRKKRLGTQRQPAGGSHHPRGLDSRLLAVS